MANIPGATNALPGVFGPSGTEIIKTDKGYAIGFQFMNLWGGPWIEGSVRDIAIKAFKIITKWPPDIDGLIERGFTPLVFEVELQPYVVCRFQQSVHIDERINQEEFITELTKEITRLSKISAFI